MGDTGLNVVIFQPVLRLVLDNRKIVNTLEIIDKIHDLILEESRISATLIDEQQGISRDRVGFIILEDLDMPKLSAK